MSTSRLGIRKIFLETTNYCNFNCEFCPIRVSRRKRQHMDFGLVRQTIDEIARHQICDVIAFYLLGEPMMYPHIVEAVRHCQARGLRSEITSNGSLLTATNVAQLVEAGLDKLTISLQRYGDEDHRERGASMPFDRYYQGILQAIRALNETDGQTRCVLAFMNAATRRLYEIDLPMAINGDRATFQEDLLTIIHDLYAALGIETDGHERQIRAAVAKLSTYRAFLYRINRRTLVGMKPFLDWGNAFTDRPIYPARFGFCSLAFSSVSILSDGTVTICCADYDGRTSPGNINDRTLVAILTSERIRAAHQAMGHYRLLEPQCQYCFGAPSRPKTILRSLAMTGVSRIFRPGPGKQVQEIDPLAA